LLIADFQDVGRGPHQAKVNNQQLPRIEQELFKFLQTPCPEPDSPDIHSAVTFAERPEFMIPFGKYA